MASKAVLLVNLKTLIDELDSPEEQELENKIVENLPEKFREDFRRALNNSDTNIEFLAYWETNEDCQRAFRELAKPRINKLERMLGLLKELFA